MSPLSDIFLSFSRTDRISIDSGKWRAYYSLEVVA
jgi:hypothetical protein